jgi:hypothetical protein
MMQSFLSCVVVVVLGPPDVGAVRTVNAGDGDQ